MKVSYDYSGKVVLVTGGARGIGRQICESFAASGAQVVTCARRAPEQSFNSSSIAFDSIDIRDAQATESYLTDINARFGRLDVLVNNAGGSPLVDSELASANFTRKIIELNLVAPLVLCQQAYAYLSQQQNASIINIASISDIRPSPRTSAYGAAKAGIINAGRSLAQEWGAAVRVNAIVAGMVKTELTEQHYGSRELELAIADTIGLKRFCLPSDIANAAMFLASNEAAYISGAALEVHGGGEVAFSVRPGNLS